jgi:hypothetical protein
MLSINNSRDFMLFRPTAAQFSLPLVQDAFYVLRYDIPCGGPRTFPFSDFFQLLKRLSGRRIGSENKEFLDGDQFFPVLDVVVIVHKFDNVITMRCFCLASILSP